MNIRPLMNSTAVYMAEGAAGGALEREVVTPPAGGETTTEGEGEGSLLETGGNRDVGTKVVSPADFPEDWRDKLAAGDKDFRKTLDRMKSPVDLAKSYRQAQLKISQGAKLAGAEKPGADDVEGLKAWREANGVPEESNGYKFSDTLQKVMTDADKPNVELFTASMHKRDMPPGAVNAALETYFEMLDNTMAATTAADKQASTKIEDDLRKEWGTDFRANMNLATAFAVKNIGPDWMNARLPDGTLLGNKLSLVQAMAGLGKQFYGDSAFAGDEAAGKTTSRIEELQSIMKNDNDQWRSNPKLRAELIKLTEAQEAKEAARKGR